jgi:hypothetical protein
MIHFSEIVGDRSRQLSVITSERFDWIQVDSNLMWMPDYLHLSKRKKTFENVFSETLTAVVPSFSCIEWDPSLDLDHCRIRSLQQELIHLWYQQDHRSALYFLDHTILQHTSDPWFGEFCRLYWEQAVNMSIQCQHLKSRMSIHQHKSVLWYHHWKHHSDSF